MGKVVPSVRGVPHPAGSTAAALWDLGGSSSPGCISAALTPQQSPSHPEERRAGKVCGGSSAPQSCGPGRQGPRLGFHCSAWKTSPRGPLDAARPPPRLAGLSLRPALRSQSPSWGLKTSGGMGGRPVMPDSAPPHVQRPPAGGALPTSNGRVSQRPPESAASARAGAGSALRGNHFNRGCSAFSPKECFECSESWNIQTPRGRRPPRHHPGGAAASFPPGWAGGARRRQGLAPWPHGVPCPHCRALRS